MFNSLLYERERKRHERSFENFISCEHFCRFNYLFIYSRGERERRGRGGGVVSRFCSSRRRARESVFDLSLVSSHLGKDSVVVVVSLVCVVKGREDTNHHPRVLKERDRTERHRAGE
jgi:hypothetical protein